MIEVCDQRSSMLHVYCLTPGHEDRQGKNTMSPLQATLRKTFGA